MASEISGLPALRGYLKVGNLVVRLSVPFVHRPQVQPPFIERTHVRASRTTAALTPEAGVSPPSGSRASTQDVNRFLERGRELELE
jgi:hypothetical protein